MVRWVVAEGGSGDVGGVRGTGRSGRTRRQSSEVGWFGGGVGLVVELGQAREGACGNEAGPESTEGAGDGGRGGGRGTGGGSARMSARVDTAWRRRFKSFSLKSPGVSYSVSPGFTLYFTTFY